MSDYPAVPPAPAPVADRTAPGRAAALITLLGSAAAAVGLFALPLQSGQAPVSDDVGFVAVRQLAAEVGDRSIGPAGSSFTSAFGELWWWFGLFLVLALVLAGLCVLVVGTAVRPAGIAVAVLGILALAGQGAALAQTASYTSFRVQLRADQSLYDHAGVGIWVGYAGLFVIVAGGLAGALGGRR